MRDKQLLRNLDRIAKLLHAFNCSAGCPPKSPGPFCTWRARACTNPTTKQSFKVVKKRVISYQGYGLRPKSAASGLAAKFALFFDRVFPPDLPTPHDYVGIASLLDRRKPLDKQRPHPHTCLVVFHDRSPRILHYLSTVFRSKSRRSKVAVCSLPFEAQRGIGGWWESRPGRTFITRPVCCTGSMQRGKQLWHPSVGSEGQHGNGSPQYTPVANRKVAKAMWSGA